MYKHTKFVAALLAVIAMLSSVAGTVTAAEASGFDDSPVTDGGMEPEE